MQYGAIKAEETEMHMGAVNLMLLLLYRASLV